MAETLVAKIAKTPEGMREFQREYLILSMTEAISEAMKERKINRSQLAKRLGTSKGHVTQVLSGSANMTLKTVADIFTALDRALRVEQVPIEEIIEQQPTMEFSIPKREVHRENWPAKLTLHETMGLKPQARRTNNQDTFAA